jgi:UDP-N-acetylglucosamine 2-epimerase (non-hydrolysing)
MPEETNRILTDHLSEILFTTEPSGARHLAHEGIAADKVYMVGNTMIDSLKEFRERALELAPWKARGLHEKDYALVTLHRPENVEHPGRLAALHEALEATGSLLPVLFPVHPRTQLRFEEQGMTWQKVELCEPLGYLEFLGLMAAARIVLTDSGGIQEETTALGVPCLTLRDNTERPITAELGTNRILGTNPDRILSAVTEVIENGHRLSARVPDLWDGRAAVRIVDILENWVSLQHEHHASSVSR